MVIASYILGENNGVPYVTTTEVLNSPTAASLDFTSLIPGGSAGQQTAALQDLIIRASAKADNYVYGALGTLSATSNTENGRYRGNRLGQFIIQPHYWPILELQTFAYGTTPGSGLQPVTLSADNVSIERHEFIVTQDFGLSTTVEFGSLNLIAGGFPADYDQFCQWTYVNGFANTFTSSAITAGATTINVTNATGIYAGMTLTVWDGQYTEQVVVASTYSTGSAIPLVAGTANAHAIGVNISALPATVKQAVIHFVCAMVTERGAGGLVLSEIGESTSVSNKTLNTEWHESQGFDLLDDFRQIWGRA
jgi:hypothetical protein